jgi:hypothetical protein
MDQYPILVLGFAIDRLRYISEAPESVQCQVISVLWGREFEHIPINAPTERDYIF